MRSPRSQKKSSQLKKSSETVGEIENREEEKKNIDTKTKESDTIENDAANSTTEDSPSSDGDKIFIERASLLSSEASAKSYRGFLNLAIILLVNHF